MDSKSKGDLAEAFVNRVAYSTFLKYWCYPNPRDLTKDNKEICDLLVVFDSICIIISVKSYSFKGDYGKYFRKTVDSALRQISGAERKLFGDRRILIQHPDRTAELFPKEHMRDLSNKSCWSSRPTRAEAKVKCTFNESVCIILMV